MRKYSEKELEFLNIQIGCMLRLARLKKGISQHELALSLDSNSTMIGRIERFESISGWDKILILSQQLDFDFCDLFDLKDKDKLISIVEETLKYEDKLTQEKQDYYNSLKTTIRKKYESLTKK